uniref:FERM domain-containing protein 8 n=2 Tax=Caenorhabditis japonica TaxID=281687 RepID=A0A8R1DMG5_CAEJA
MASKTLEPISEIEPAEGRKHLSKQRNVQLPLDNFGKDDVKVKEQEQHAESLPYSPIQQALRTIHNQSTETSESPKPVNFRIYLTRMEYSAFTENGIDLSIESGKTANSKLLLFYLAREYKIDKDVFTEMFAIWMISPLLEVQLKPYHRPYECRQGWKTLLNRFYDDKSEELFDQDEPILMLRRNASLSSERELEILSEYPQCADLLIIDAADMIFLGRLHFLSIDHTVCVAALLFSLQHEKFDEDIHDVAFIRAHLEEILPERTCDSILAKRLFGKAINKKTAQEDNLLTYWKDKLSKLTKSERQNKLLRELTETSSCYGAAWFAARIEIKTSRVSLRNFGQKFTEVKVNVGINDRWLTIVDAATLQPLLVQSIEELTWQLETPKEENQMPYLILNLSSDEQAVNNDNGVSIDITDSETTFFLMVIGNQTLLIDALLKTMTGQRLERTISDVIFISKTNHIMFQYLFQSSSSGSSISSEKRHDTLIQSKLEIKYCSPGKSRKLCLAKFENGKCTEVAGTFKSFFCYGQTL